MIWLSVDHGANPSTSFLSTSSLENLAIKGYAQQEKGTHLIQLC
jgi:hypothetical protein